MYVVHTCVAMIIPGHANSCYFGKRDVINHKHATGKACESTPSIMLVTGTVSLRLSRLLFEHDVCHNMHTFSQFSLP